MATLHIVGNGFDLAHGIESKYSDFKKNTLKPYYMGLLEDCYPEKDVKSGELMLWSDLEKALGNLNFQRAFSLGTEDIKLEEDHESRYNTQMEDAPEYMLRDMYAAFHKMFEDWVNNINIDFEKLENIPYFETQGLFLSFNYTETLETLYNIPRDKIKYIHGRRKSQDKLIVGHCNDVDGSKYLPNDPEYYKYQAYRNMASVVNGEQKDVSEIITGNSDFWLKISNVDKVVVYGHSLSNVDQPYFKKIADSIKPTSEWYFSIHYHNCQERKEKVNKILDMIKYINVKRCKCHTFKM